MRRGPLAKCTGSSCRMTEARIGFGRDGVAADTFALPAAMGAWATGRTNRREGDAMPDEVHFDRDEIDRLHAIAAEARDALVDRVRAEFSDDKAAEALCFALAILAASGFAPGEVEQQHDMALAINQVASRSSYPIPWRMTLTAAG